MRLYNLFGNMILLGNYCETAMANTNLNKCCNRSKCFWTQIPGQRGSGR